MITRTTASPNQCRARELVLAAALNGARVRDGEVIQQGADCHRLWDVYVGAGGHCPGELVHRLVARPKRDESGDEAGCTPSHGSCDRSVSCLVCFIAPGLRLRRRSMISDSRPTNNVDCRRHRRLPSRRSPKAASSPPFRPGAWPRGMHQHVLSGGGSLPCAEAMSVNHIETIVFLKKKTV